MLYWCVYVDCRTGGVPLYCAVAKRFEARMVHERKSRSVRTRQPRRARSSRRPRTERQPQGSWRKTTAQEMDIDHEPYAQVQEADATLARTKIESAAQKRERSKAARWFLGDVPELDKAVDGARGASLGSQQRPGGGSGVDRKYSVLSANNSTLGAQAAEIPRDSDAGRFQTVGLAEHRLWCGRMWKLTDFRGSGATAKHFVHLGTRNARWHPHSHANSRAVGRLKHGKRERQKPFWVRLECAGGESERVCSAVGLGACMVDWNMVVSHVQAHSAAQ